MNAEGVSSRGQRGGESRNGSGAAVRASGVESKSLDRELALRLVGGNADLLREIAQLFLEDAPNLLGSAERAVRAGDAHALERAAHSLKGAVSNFGAACAYQAALDLEMIGRDKRLSQAPAAFHELKSTLAALQPELEALATG